MVFFVAILSLIDTLTLRLGINASDITKLKLNNIHTIAVIHLKKPETE
jgi:hypothetical protein